MQSLLTLFDLMCSQDARDVLADHRKKNKATRAPTNDNLIAAAHRQINIDIASEPGDDADDENGEDSDGDQPGCRARRHSKSTGEPKPTSLEYYPLTWREALTTAKLKYRRFMVLHNAFPSRDDDIQQARQIIFQVVEDMKLENDTIFDPGKVNQISTPDLSLIFIFSAIQHTRAMDVLVRLCTSQGFL